MEYMRPPPPEDESSFCVSLRMLGADPLDRAQVVRRLQGWPLRDVVIALDEMFRGSLYAHSTDDEIALADRYLATDLANEFKAAIAGNPRISLIAPRAVMVTLVHALAYCPVAGKVPSRFEERLGTAVLSMGEEIDGPPLDIVDVPLVVARQSAALQVTALHGRAADEWADLSHRLLFEILPRLDAHADFVDVRAAIETEYECSLEEFWAILAVYAQGALLTTSPDGAWATTVVGFEDRDTPTSSGEQAIRRITRDCRAWG